MDKRERKVPLTYWEQYVETDEWYRQKLLEDVPPEEMYAALHDEELSDDERSDDEESGSESVEFVVAPEPDEEWCKFLKLNTEEDDEDGSYSSDGDGEDDYSDSEEDESDCTESGSDEEGVPVQRATEGKRRRQGADEQGASGAVGEERARAGGVVSFISFKKI